MGVTVEGGHEPTGRGEGGGLPGDGVGAATEPLNARPRIGHGLEGVQGSEGVASAVERPQHVGGKSAGEVQRHARGRRGAHLCHLVRHRMEHIIGHRQDQDAGALRDRPGSGSITNTGIVEQRVRRRIVRAPEIGEVIERAGLVQRTAQREPHPAGADDAECIGHAAPLTSMPSRCLSRPSVGVGNRARISMVVPRSSRLSTSPSR